MRVLELRATPEAVRARGHAMTNEEAVAWLRNRAERYSRDALAVHRTDGAPSRDYLMYQFVADELDRCADEMEAT